MQSVQAQAHGSDKAYRNRDQLCLQVGGAVCSSVWAYMVSDVSTLSGVLILRKLAEKGSTTSGRPGIAPGRNAEQVCAL